MITQEKYTIQHKGLNQGSYKYNFQADTSFFNALDYQDISKAELKITVTLHKRAQLLELHFEISGTLTMDCDRCLDPYSFPFRCLENMVIRFGENVEDEDDSVFYISESESKLDISQFIYEFVVLNLPKRIVHPESKGTGVSCNKKMLKKLDGISIEQVSEDPRWAGLKEIKKKMNKK